MSNVGVETTCRLWSGRKVWHETSPQSRLDVVVLEHFNFPFHSICEEIVLHTIEIYTRAMNGGKRGFVNR